MKYALKKSKYCSLIKVDFILCVFIAVTQLYAFFLFICFVCFLILFPGKYRIFDCFFKCNYILKKSYHPALWHQKFAVEHLKVRFVQLKRSIFYITPANSQCSESEIKIFFPCITTSKERLQSNHYVTFILKYFNARVFQLILLFNISRIVTFTLESQL